MLIPPDIPEGAIAAGLEAAYGVRARRVAFLPLGADMHAALYRVDASDGASYLLKLRRGRFDAASVEVPAYLHHAEGIGSVLAPLPTMAQRLWSRGLGFTWVLYPFLAGANGFARPLSDSAWRELGAVMRAVHRASLSAELLRLVPRETYAPHGPNAARRFGMQLHQRADDGDPFIRELAGIWHARREEIEGLVERAGELAAVLETRAMPFVLCHGDLHAGNVMTTPEGAVHVVDWDSLILAPKERDLMFVGAGIGGVWNSPREEALFLEGYERDGAACVDAVARAYYRYERIVVDLGELCELVLDVGRGEEDRAEAIAQLCAQFSPGNVVEQAHRADPPSP